MPSREERQALRQAEVERLISETLPSEDVSKVKTVVSYHKGGYVKVTLRATLAKTRQAERAAQISLLKS